MKKIGKIKYVHRSNTNELLQYLDKKEQIDLKRCIDVATELGFGFEVIKFNGYTGGITLIQSNNFDEANEPDVGDSLRFDCNRNFKFQKAKGQIYHMKELFVAADYGAFNREEAAKRTRTINEIPNLDKRKIGYKRYWSKVLSENGLEW